MMSHLCPIVGRLAVAPRLWGVSLGLWAALWSGPNPAAGAGPADVLFRLAPPESSVVLAVEDLRSGAQRVEASTLDDDLRRLPIVASWLESDRFRRLQRAASHLGVGLGVPIRTVFEEVLGDAFVLVFQAGRDGKVDRSSGLVLIRPRQPQLLEQLIKTRNVAQSKQGALIQIDSRRHGATQYSSRLFRPGVWPSDHYVFFEDGTFAWSNSEAVIHDVIDRRAGKLAGWDSSPTAARLRIGLPASALASLFVAPAVVDQLLSTSPSAMSLPRRYFHKVAATYLKAVQGIGFALEWRDGFTLHSHEIVDPNKLPPWMTQWMARPTQRSPLLGHLPGSALGVISGRFDFAAALRAIRLLVDPDDRAAWESAEQAAHGLALGQNLEDLLAKVEPHFVVTLTPKEVVEGRSWLTVVGGTTWLDPDEEEVPPWTAVDNAFRTGMAVHAFRPLRRGQYYRVETRQIEGQSITDLGPPSRSILAYQSDPDRFVLSNSAEAIAPFGRPSNASAAPSPLMVLRDRYAAQAETFAIVDLPRLADAVVQSKKSIVRDLASRSGQPAAEVDRDLVQFLALANLFRAAVVTSNANRDATEVHRTISLIAR